MKNKEHSDDSSINYTVKELLADVKEQLSRQQSSLERIEQHVIVTNGKVKLNRWIATTSLMVVLTLVGWFLAHLNAGG